METGSFQSRLIVLYRPPYSEEHPVTMGTFLAEFATFVESIILAPEPLIIAGDFNIHVDRGNDCNDAARFLDILRSMGLTQHVNGLTHDENGHTLDFIITRSFDGAISTKPVVDTHVSDQVKGYLFAGTSQLTLLHFVSRSLLSNFVLRSSEISKS